MKKKLLLHLFIKTKNLIEFSLIFKKKFKSISFNLAFFNLVIIISITTKKLKVNFGKTELDSN